MCVVIGNRHPPSGYIAYIKYRPVSHETPWSRGNVFYERIVKYYLPMEIHGSVFDRIYDPWSDSYVPFTPRSIVSRIYDPRKRLYSMIHRTCDRLEEEAIGLAEIIRREANIPWSCLGVTGSILVGIHNIVASDIDLVVYGYSCCWKVIDSMETISDHVKGFDRVKLLRWSSRLSRRYGIPIEHVIRLYRVWRRGVYGGREYSISYSSDHPRGFHGDKWVTIGYGRVKAYVEPIHGSVDYPVRASISRYSVIEYSVSREPGLSEVVSYETFFMPALVREGWRIVDGIIQYNPVSGRGRIVVGVKERMGFIIIRDSS